jgi:DNA-directed RNA polymerase subunit L
VENDDNGSDINIDNICDIYTPLEFQEACEIHSLGRLLHPELITSPEIRSLQYTLEELSSQGIINIYIYICIQTYTSFNSYMNIYIHTCMHIYMRINQYTCVFIQIDIYIYINTCKYRGYRRCRSDGRADGRYS